MLLYFLCFVVLGFVLLVVVLVVQAVKNAQAKFHKVAEI
jgi:hypothetical protein